jgi:hypothetical protein
MTGAVLDGVAGASGPLELGMTLGLGTVAGGVMPGDGFEPVGAGGRFDSGADVVGPGWLVSELPGPTGATGELAGAAGAVVVVAGVLVASRTAASEDADGSEQLQTNQHDQKSKRWRRGYSRGGKAKRIGTRVYAQRAASHRGTRCFRFVDRALGPIVAESSRIVAAALPDSSLGREMSRCDKLMP